MEVHLGLQIKHTIKSLPDVMLHAFYIPYHTTIYSSKKKLNVPITAKYHFLIKKNFEKYFLEKIP